MLKRFTVDELVANYKVKAAAIKLAEEQANREKAERLANRQVQQSNNQSYDQSDNQLTTQPRSQSDKPAVKRRRVDQSGRSSPSPQPVASPDHLNNEQSTSQSNRRPNKQSSNQSIDQSNKQSIKQSNRQSVKQTSEPSIEQSNEPPLDPLSSQAAMLRAVAANPHHPHLQALQAILNKKHQANNQSINQTNNRSNIQSNNQSNNQSNSQSTKQSTNQPAIQPVIRKTKFAFDPLNRAHFLLDQSGIPTINQSVIHVPRWNRSDLINQTINPLFNQSHTPSQFYSSRSYPSSLLASLKKESIDQSVEKYEMMLFDKRPMSRRDQSIKQSLNQSINRSINQSINRSSNPGRTQARATSNKRSSTPTPTMT